MNKLGLMLFVPLLMCSILFGKETSTGTNTKSSAGVSELETASLQQSKEMLRWNSVLDKLGIGDERVLRAEAEKKVGPARETSVIRRKLQRTRETKRGIDAYLSRKWTGPRSDVSSWSLAKTLVVGTIPAKFVNTAGDSIVSYAAGDTIGIVITSSDSVWIDIYVDDGNGTLDPAADFTFEPGDGDEEIVIIDGDMDDEDTTAGVWKITFDTGDIEEGGEIFGLQGARLFFELSDPAANTGSVIIDVLPPATTTSISGVVQMEDLTAAPNMVVAAFPTPMTEMEGPPMSMVITMTDTSGAYTLAVPDDDAGQDYMVFAMDVWYLYSGLFPDPFMHQTYVGAGDNLYGLDFTLKAGTVAFSGTITDEDGVSVVGLSLYFNTGPYDVEVVTGPVGDYSVTLIGGHWNAWPDEGDLESMGYMIPHGGDFDVVDGEVYTGNDLVLYFADAPIQGTVTWSDGSFAEGIEVQASTWDNYARTRTGPDGNYTLMVSSTLDSIEVTDEGDNTWTNIGYWVSAWGEDALCQPGEYNGVRAGETGINFTMYAADAVFSGHVYYEDTSDPMREVQLEAFTIEDTLWFRSNARTDGNGYFEMNLVSGFTWQVDVHRPDMWWPPALSDTIYVASGSNPVRDYYLTALVTAVTVDGMVYGPDGKPIAGAQVELFQTDGPYIGNTATDGGGYFIFHDVPSFSEFDIKASAPAYEPVYERIYVGDEPYHIDLWLGMNWFLIYGSVFGAGDEGLPEAFVFAKPLPDGEPFMTVTNENGFFELFVPGGAYVLQAGAAGYLADTTWVDVIDATLADFYLNSAEGQLTESVSGTVTDDLGNTVPKVLILFMSADYITHTFTDINGLYALDLVPGSYRASFHREGFHPTVLDVTTPVVGALDVVLYPRAYLEVTAVTDVEPDHGGKAAVTWVVNPAIHGMIKYFAIWQMGVPGDPGNPALTRVADHISTHQKDQPYRLIVPTEIDGVEHFYAVVAYDHNDFPQWGSDPVGGISSDNIAPEVTASALSVASGATALDVALTWSPAIDDPATDKPVASYIIHRGGETGDLVPVADGITATEYTETLPAYGTYRYAVSATDFAGNESVLSEVVTYAVLSVADGQAIPEVYALGANYPNPFNPSTTITFQLPEAEHVTLQVYDLTGKVVKTLVGEYRPAGYHQVVWNGRDSKAAPVATGVYFYRIVAGQAYTETRKMVLMK